MRATLSHLPARPLRSPFPSLQALYVRRPALPAKWKIADVYKGDSFYDGFEFFTYPDPTDGLVNYVSMKEAIKLNLTHADDSSFVIRGDQSAN
ncbi:hypothetical protein BKA62DRAFT_775069 [Auriculariales sp. MPI-PUGE-AT-0066]|nr:hypothetical protein BKA62DRAFT_775069 [Auriculariales sp. MPI-PUGE-AT-0066]